MASGLEQFFQLLRGVHVAHHRVRERSALQGDGLPANGLEQPPNAVFPGGEGSDVNTLGIVCALVSAFTYGGYLIANEKGPANDLPIETKLFYVSLPGTVLFGILAPLTGTLAAPAQLSGWLYVLASGLFTV